MLTVAVPKRNKLQNIIVLTPKDGRLKINFIHKYTSYSIFFHFLIIFLHLLLYYNYCMVKSQAISFCYI